MFHTNPSLVEPAGAKVLKRMGTRCYLGILLETYHGENGQALFRGIYSDALVSRVHMFGLTLFCDTYSTSVRRRIFFLTSCDLNRLFCFVLKSDTRLKQRGGG